MLKPSLQLKLGQQLTMTPQLQQAIRLLQLPVLELQAQVREALETNVMLEAEDESGSLETGETAVEPQFESTAASSSEESTESSEREVEVDQVEEQDWSDSQSAGPSESPWSGDDEHSQDFSDARGETLQEHLTWQLEMSRLDERDQRIGAAIIDAINDDGYLIEPLDEIARNLQPELTVPATEVERVLQHVQAMDPAGVGARSVGECIELQLRQLDPDTPGRETALAIAAGYLDQLAEQQYAQLRRQLRVSEEEMDHALVLVRACQPRPGSSVHSVPAEYIVPDVFVRRTERGWAVEINPASLPRIRAADHAMLRTQLQEARWLIRSLEIRNETLLKVARCIVQRQSAFLQNGDEYMQPMILKDVAEAVEMHESTISRVTTNKYMHTPRGVFEFRYFFSSHVANSDGTEMSSTAIRAKIRKLVAQEEPDKPLSDSRIADILSQEGVLVARRTVAKYREALGIPPSSERKRVPVR
jgi:RNA polymerase sigma-54 factor